MDLPRPGPSPDSDVSPFTKVAPKQHDSSADYFSSASSTSRSQDGLDQDQDNGAGTTASTASTASRESSITSALPRRKSGVSFPSELPRLDHSAGEDTSDGTTGRKSSTSSITFRPPQNPSLPQGRQRRTNHSRIRASSPPYQR
ncbi:hypothetical protein HIM_05877 [Hirsutella minnesotensis 3608]|uniref:Uncharacterized protein n=1 Tax=Hirsutella minnesotensis 3608 TaxID=1043627 RepID=A0A0F7ZP25_9HYPO|nr:hypothetical protein HIM_05877 [Hirsutella minnesotensis 3608]